MQDEDNPGQTDENAPSQDQEADQPSKTNTKRKRTRKWLLLGLTGVFVVAVILYGAYWLLVLRYYESTDDAYVHGNKIMVTPQINGTVVDVYADETDLVKAGQPLIKLDRSNTTVALQHSEANLARTVRQVRQTFAQEKEQESLIEERKARLAQAERDFKRNTRLLKVHGVSRKQYQHADTTLQTAKAGLAAAKHKLTALQAMTEGTTLLTHPDVKLAESKLKAAYLNFQRTTIPAPITGYVAKRGVNVGQKVSPSKPMLAIVPLSQIWIQANFKETNVQKMRIGQPVTVHADFYGDDVTYHGRVAGISPGTGSAFELLPPQNATGNWIKVVHRIPVRITLKPEELKKHPLRLGLSMSVKVDSHNTNGQVLAQTPTAKPVYSTDVYSKRKSGAHDLITRIVNANAGGMAHMAKAGTAKPDAR